MNTQKFLLCLMFTLGTATARAQNPEPPCWYTPSWDWTNLEVENWKGFWQGQDPDDDHYIDVPWNTNGTNGNVFNIADLHDYRAEQGWVLLWKDFGCANVDVPGGYPHFFLYNKFTAVVRCFFYVPQNLDLVDEGKLEISWHQPDNNTSLLTHTNQFAKPNDVYPETGNDETAYVIISDNTGQGWIVGEYMVNFDHHNLSDEEAHTIRFSLSNLTNSDLNATATFSFETASKSLKEANSINGTPGDEPGVEDFEQDGKQVVSGLPEWETIEGYVEQLTDLIPEGGESAPDPATFNTTIVLSDFMNYINISQDEPEQEEEEQAHFFISALEGIEAAAPYVKVAFTLFDLFAGKPSEDEDGAPTFQPTVSSGSLTMTGTITTSDDALNRFIDVPGMDHQVNTTEDYVGVPVYDCPLGNIALEEMPMVEKTTYSTVCGWWPAWYACQDPPPGAPNCYTQTPISIPMDSYRITEDVVMALNKASGLSVGKLWAAFVAEENGAPGPFGGGQYGSVLDNVGWNYGVTTGIINSALDPAEWYDNVQDMPHQFYNPARQYLENGTYLFSRATPSLPLRYGTPMIPMDEFKNTAFNVTRGNRVCLKVAAVMLPDDVEFYEPTAVMWGVTYEITGNSMTIVGSTTDFGTNSQFPFTWEQQFERLAQIVTSQLEGQDEILDGSELDVYIRQGDFAAFNIVADNSQVHSDLNNVNFKAESHIRMTPGFKASAAENRFRAYIERSSSYADGANAMVVNEYNLNCDEYPFRSAAYSPPGWGANPSASLMSVTPREGDLLVQNKQEQTNIHVQIFDALGKLVVNLNASNLQNNAVLNIGLLPAGLYIYRQQTTTGAEEKKFVVQ